MKNNLILTIALCILLTFAPNVHANGNISADLPPEPPVNREVRRATVRRAPTPAKPAATNAQNSPKAQTTQPNQPTSLAMGIRMMEQARYEQAHAWLQKAVQEERNNPYAWYWYGVVHDKAGQYDQAQFFYTRAIELDPAFPPFSRVLAYPDDGDRKALWDPLRPARVYPIEPGDPHIAIVPPDAPNATQRRPAPAVDPALPEVPVYVPPDTLSAPGYAVQPPVYVPPPVLYEPEAPGEAAPMWYTGDAPVYIPPQPQQ